MGLSTLPGWADPLIAAGPAAGENVEAALRRAEEYGRALPLPGCAPACWHGGARGPRPALLRASGDLAGPGAG